MCYVGKKSCGCIVIAHVVGIGAAEALAEMAADGLIIETMPSERVRLAWGKCPHEVEQLELFQNESE